MFVVAVVKVFLVIVLNFLVCDLTRGMVSFMGAMFDRTMFEVGIWKKMGIRGGDYDVSCGVSCYERFREL